MAVGGLPDQNRQKWIITMDNYDLTKEDDVVSYMRKSKSEAEWNERCNAVKKANDNGYPAFWYKAIMISGVAGQMTALWKRQN